MVCKVDFVFFEDLCGFFWVFDDSLPVWEGDYCLCESSGVHSMFPALSATIVTVAYSCGGLASIWVFLSVIVVF